MSQDIGAGDYVTKIPSLSDDADIQEALKLYHYGDEFEPTKSMVYHLARIEAAALSSDVVDINTVTENANNLNNFINTGFFIQPSDANATSGQNYPKINNVGYAGSLKVVAFGSTDATKIVYQEYHLSGSNQNTVFWRNRFPNQSSQYVWSDWKQLVDTNHTHDDRYYQRAQVFNPSNADDPSALGYTKSQADGKFLTLNNLPASSPVGSMMLWPTNTAPTGWLICDGREVSRGENADLFNVIGITYGFGNGSTTFNLPDLRSRVPVGRDERDSSFDALAQTGGAKTHTLTTSEMPSHTHAGPNHSHSFSGSGSASSYTYAGSSIRMRQDNNFYHGFSDRSFTVRISGNTSSASGTTGSAGSNGAHNNMQPYVVLNYIIKSIP